MSPAAVIQAHVDAFNAHDLEGFIATFHPDVEAFDLGGEQIYAGRDAARARQAPRFDGRALKAEIPHRIVVGDRVVDHEIVWLDGADKPPVELVIVYTLQDGLIRRMDYVR